MYPTEYMVITTQGGGGEEVSFYEDMEKALRDGVLSYGRVYEVRKIADFEPDV